MKKITITILLIMVCTTAFYGNAITTGSPMISFSDILRSYGFKGGAFSVKSSTIDIIDFLAQMEYGEIEKSITIDTPEEFITATYFSPIEVQCVQARLQIEQVLPQNNKIEAGIKLGAMWYQKMVAYQFAAPAGSDKSEQLARYDLIMKTISERTGATRIQMVNAFRAGVRAVIAETVKAQFNTISFVANGGGRTYSTVLQRNGDNSYVMKYQGFFNGVQEDREISGSNLNQLISRMNQSSDFNPTIINVIRNKTETIPGLLYERWVGLGMAEDPMALITDGHNRFLPKPHRGEI